MFANPDENVKKCLNNAIKIVCLFPSKVEAINNRPQRSIKEERRSFIDVNISILLQQILNHN